MSPRGCALNPCGFPCRNPAFMRGGVCSFHRALNYRIVPARMGRRWSLGDAGVDLRMGVSRRATPETLVQHESPYLNEHFQPFRQLRARPQHSVRVPPPAQRPRQPSLCEDLVRILAMARTSLMTAISTTSTSLGLISPAWRGGMRRVRSPLPSCIDDRSVRPSGTDPARTLKYLASQLSVD